METNKELLETLIKQQFDQDDHGIYIYGRREDYSHASQEHIKIKDKIPSLKSKGYLNPKDAD